MPEIKFRPLLLFSALFRVVLILYGEWQDAHLEVRYTDVDYFVFSDAAALMSSGKSPYEKINLSIFAVDSFSSDAQFVSSSVVGKIPLLCIRILKLRGVPEKLCTYSTMLWLFNPFTFMIGTRGNCEPIVCSIILWILICLMNGHFLQAAFWYGLVVHLRIYPIIYALPIIILLDPLYFQPGKNPALVDWSSRTSKSSMDSTNRKIAGLQYILNFFSSLITWRRVMFGILSGSTFLILTGLCFHLYGWEFLNEALLYHLTRTDPRHNFSIYFYHIYLHYEHEFSILEKLISFFPQFIIQLVLIFCFALDLPFCLFLQTLAFVAFNKVITAQYFVWFFCLLPLILPWSNMKLKWQGVACISMWIGAQTHWLMWGYMLEFRGKNVFLQLWVASLLFLAANTFVLINVIRSHAYCPLFKPLPANASKSAKDD